MALTLWARDVQGSVKTIPCDRARTIPKGRINNDVHLLMREGMVLANGRGPVQSAGRYLMTKIARLSVSFVSGKLEK